jgi:hypothetical protein
MFKDLLSPISISVCCVVRCRISLSSPSKQTVTYNQVPIQWRAASHTSRIKQPEREINHSVLSIFYVKKIYTLSPPQYTFFAMFSSIGTTELFNEVTVT